MVKNTRYLKALRQEEVDMTPIWLMRQAGRYLPEYQKIRREAGSFMNLCQTPELACEVTLQPLERFDLDAAILFSDILTIPDALGLGLYFVDGSGPKFERPLSSVSDIENLGIVDPEVDLSYVVSAVSLIKQELHDKVPLIGFAGSPWTLACYMVEGSSSKNFHKIKSLLFNYPSAMHLLLDKLTESVIAYLKAQISAGAEAIQLFDSWGGILSTHNYLDFSLHYMQKVVHALKGFAPNVPITLFTKGGGLWLEKIADTKCDAISLDWSTDILDAKQRVQNKVALQGNLDPGVLLSSNPDMIYQEVQVILDKFGNNPGHIFNLGHGITPDILPENVQVLVEAVHSLSQNIR